LTFQVADARPDRGNWQRDLPVSYGKLGSTFRLAGEKVKARCATPGSIHHGAIDEDVALQRRVEQRPHPLRQAYRGVGTHRPLGCRRDPSWTHNQCRSETLLDACIPHLLLHGQYWLAGPPSVASACAWRVPRWIPSDSRGAGSYNVSHRQNPLNRSGASSV
jgi:hypothetical protein